MQHLAFRIWNKSGLAMLMMTALSPNNSSFHAVIEREWTYVNNAIRGHHFGHEAHQAVQRTWILGKNVFEK